MTDNARRHDAGRFVFVGVIVRAGQELLPGPEG
jgi:hypothetical protein